MHNVARFQTLRQRLVTQVIVSQGIQPMNSLHHDIQFLASIYTDMICFGSLGLTFVTLTVEIKGIQL